MLVLKQYGQEAADAIDWSAPRLLCIAEAFSKYDEHAVEQINRNIELIRYMAFTDDLLLLDLVNIVTATQEPDPGDGSTSTQAGGKQKYTTQQEYLERASSELQELYEAVRAYITELGDDVQERWLKWYIAFKRIRNFATVQLQTSKNGLLMWLPLDPDSVTLEDGFSRDVRGVGHHGTGDIELSIRSLDDL